MRPTRIQISIITVLASTLWLSGCSKNPAPEGERPDSAQSETSQSETSQSGTDEGSQASSEQSSQGQESAPKEETEQQQAMSAKGKKLYQTRCATCHGKNGKGEGMLAKSLDPKPRDHTNPEWQDSVTDKEIATVIKDGGPAAGLSATMPAHPGLSDSDVQALVDYIRSLRSEGSSNSEG